jgi:hypothetical protein
MSICLAFLDLENAGRGRICKQRVYRTKDVRAGIRSKLGFAVRHSRYLESSKMEYSRPYAQWMLGYWEVPVSAR